MPKRGENIHKRKDGRWEARYRKGVDHSGKTVYGSVYAKTYRDAKRKQQERAAWYAKENQVSTGRSLFRDAAILWLEDSRIRLKGATENRYRNLLDSHLLPDLGDMRLDQLSGTHINAYLADKLEKGRLDGKGGLAPSYVRSMMLVIQSILNFAADNGMCPPLSTKIYKPQAESKELPILSVNDQKKLESVCLSEPNETKLGILLSLYTGLRIGEVCALEWSDLDFSKRVIHVRKTVSRVRNTDPDVRSRSVLVIEPPKTKSSFRDIPLSDWLIPIMEQVQSSGASQFITSSCPGFVSPRTYDYRYHQLLDAAGLDSINYHALRHTFATRCIEAGVDVKSLSEMLGHADASITLNTYVHSSLERQRSQLEKVRPY